MPPSTLLQVPWEIRDKIIAAEFNCRISFIITIIIVIDVLFRQIQSYDIVVTRSCYKIRMVTYAIWSLIPKGDALSPKESLLLLQQRWLRRDQRSNSMITACFVHDPALILLGISPPRWHFKYAIMCTTASLSFVVIPCVIPCLIPSVIPCVIPSVIPSVIAKTILFWRTNLWDCVL